ncbi:tetratricopeptide repeat protein [Microvirga antarctica]|uniref:tetratricopeptide repeat protein n=1 Tax=Microvirga antarctica TaxID=2819233 RepID=UPI001B316226|nr:tetratricopeptide repeat protein [Microvirga antarctica]
MSVARGAIAIAIVSLGFAAIAQQSGETVPRQMQGAGAPAGLQPAPTRPPVDESALRYFASQGDTRRVDAEVARLRALYPEWTPPTDLSQSPGSALPQTDPAVDALWQLYADGKVAEIRAAIAERQAADPNWKPPAELLVALDQSEARRRLTNASDSSQWRTVLAIATETPTLLTCANVDVLWRVAEAFAKTNQIPRARDVYTYTLTNCANPTERLGTLQKAVALLPDAQIAELLKFERRTGDTPDDFSPIRDELARRRVERASVDGKTIAAPDDLAIVERLAENPADSGNALILGYYNYHHKSPEKALEWFKLALDRNAGPKAAEGYALTLRNLNRFVEAEAFAFDWRDKAKENMQVYLDVATALLSQDPPPRLDPRVITRVIQAVTAQRFVNGAQALGWYSYNTGQFRSARDWFLKALAWNAEDEPSAYGAALSTQRLNDRAGFNAIVTKWRPRSPRIADLADGRVTAPASGRRSAGPDATTETTAAMTAPSPIAMPSSGLPAPMTTTAPATAFPQDQPDSAARRAEATRMAQADAPPPVEPLRPSAALRRMEEPARFEQTAPAEALPAARRPAARAAEARGTGRANRGCTVTRNPTSLAPGAALTLGWCLMELNRPMEAASAFDEAVKRGEGQTREEAAYGKTLAYLRKDLTAEAAVAAAEAPQSADRRRELNASILSQRALGAYREGRWMEVILALGERSRVVPEQTDLMLLRGWSYFKLGRYNDAERIFRSVQRTGYSDEANVGLNAVLERTQNIRQ